MAAICRSRCCTASASDCRWLLLLLPLLFLLLVLLLLFLLLLLLLLHSQHNLLWFCIYFASQACLRLCELLLLEQHSPAQPNPAQPALAWLQTQSRAEPSCICRFSRHLAAHPLDSAAAASLSWFTCAAPGTSVSGNNYGLLLLLPSTWVSFLPSLRLLVLVLYAAFAPCLQSLQPRGRPPTSSCSRDAVAGGEGRE